MEDVRDRVAFVTGGASGIGFGIVTVLLEAGAKVAIADLRPDHLEEAKRLLAAHDNRILTIEVDVTDREAMAAPADAVDAAFGRIDILVNAAGGVCGQVGRPVEEVDPAGWHAIFKIRGDPLSSRRTRRRRSSGDRGPAM